METNFPRLIHPEIVLKEFNLSTCKETKKQSLKPKGRRPIHTSDDTFATKPLTTSSKMLVELQQNYVVGQQRQQISELQFYNALIRYRSLHVLIFHRMQGLWINEVEVVESFFLKKDFPNLEMLDAPNYQNSKPRPKEV